MFGFYIVMVKSAENIFRGEHIYEIFSTREYAEKFKKLTKNDLKIKNIN